MARGNAANKRNTRKTKSKRAPGRIYGGGVKINAKSSGLSKKQKAVNRAQGQVHESSRFKQRLQKGIQGIKNRSSNDKNRRSPRGR